MAGDPLFERWSFTGDDTRGHSPQPSQSHRQMKFLRNAEVSRQALQALTKAFFGHAKAKPGHINPCQPDVIRMPKGFSGNMAILKCLDKGFVG